MRELVTALLSALLAMGAAAAAPVSPLPTGDYLPSQVPYTYILDRTNVLAPEYPGLLKEGPPVLHEGGDLTAGHPYFGPMCDLAALRAGRPEPDAAEWVARYRARRAAIQGFVKRAHAAGVQQAIAYVCMMTTGGDPRKRTGFWRFYDHWSAFAGFHIPARPAEDPEQWLQRKANGASQHFYAYEHPPYRPMFRYANCVNSPGWRTYMRWLVEEGARAGLDGVFVDNATSQHCYCPHCRDGFARWLRERYTPQELQECLGGDLSLQADLAKSDLRTAETRLFWAASIREFLGLIRQWGAAIRGSFFVFPNGLHHRAQNIAVLFPDCDLAMDENSSGATGGHPGVARSHVIAGLHITRVNDSMLSYRWAAGAGAHCRTNLMGYPGYPKADPANLGANAGVGALGIAEAAAFGGGGCYLHDGPKAAPWLGPVRARYNAFFHSNASLYRGMFPADRVGIAAFALPGFFGDRTTQSGIEQAVYALAERHIPADLIPERVFALEWIRRYPVLLVPQAPILSDAHLRALVEYARAGGTLVLWGEKVASRDALGRERPAGALEPLRAAAAAWHNGPALPDDAPWMRGLAVCAADVAPSARFALWADHPQRPGRLALHCVNYDVSLGTKHDDLGVVHDLTNAIPLPAGTRAATAVLKVPGEKDRRLPVESAGGVARVTLPELGIYAVVRLDLKRASGAAGSDQGAGGRKPGEKAGNTGAGAGTQTAGTAGGLPARAGVGKQGAGVGAAPAGPAAALRPSDPKALPLLRHEHFFVVVNEGGGAPAFWLRSKPVFTYADGVRVEVYDDRGGVRLRTHFSVGGELTREIPGPPAPFYLVAADPGMNGILFDADRPWGIVASAAHGLGSSGPVPPLFLYVPAECEKVTLTADAMSPNEGGRITLRAPAGAEAAVLDGEFDTPTSQAVPVPAEGRGKVWSLAWAAPQSVKASLDDVVLSLAGGLAPVLWKERAWAEKHGPAVCEREQGRISD